MTMIASLYSDFIQSTGISTDTRQISKDCLFIALKGANFNGNLFAKQALEQGAYKVVVDEEAVVESDDYILVDDTLIALQQLATYHRRQLNIPIIGITGTNGKTTTKELVNAVLSSKYNVFATQGNFNNHIGVPLTLLSMNDKTEVGVVEMGANHLGEIADLCLIAEPNYGLITNVGKAHLEGFGSFEGVMRTKSELYRYVENNLGTIFINKDNVYLQKMLGEGASLYTYGKDETNNISIERVANSANVNFSCKYNNEVLNIDSNLIGGYNLENLLAAIAIGCHMGVNGKDIENAIANYLPNNNRSQLVISQKNKIIFDAYNANPTSMMAALENFKEMAEKDKVVILGEMKELGEDSLKEHKAIVDFLRNNPIRRSILIGDNYKNLVQGIDNADWYPDVNKAIECLQESPISNCFILVKGSRSNRLENLKDIL
ncbi:UDP-N-acetylmuramoyl-tripeptide--D-alanyl-D-alanine ligase [Labilibacter sediminis]|nr:UDP-N-acetylmuramoyl-tripeptide--D-alanyl-D-alanine ligase [Labilibacter sediminis]